MISNDQNTPHGKLHAHSGSLLGLRVLPINMSLLCCASSLSSSFLSPLYLIQQNFPVQPKVMLSTLPAFFGSDSMIGNPFSPFENGFALWDCSEFFVSDDHDPQSPKPVGSSSGSDEPNEPREPNGSDQNTVSVIDERKRRRMISNRESARRSRMRKQRHLENLRNQVNRLRIENRELTNRLRFVLYHCDSVRRENDRLQSEHSMLRQKLSNIGQILMFKQLQQFTSAWPCDNIITTE